MLMTARSPAPFLVTNAGSALSWHQADTSLYSFLSEVLDMIFGIVRSLRASPE